jgi:ATP-dependent exoDNAse (exonuclease V) alpha subunit
VLAINAGRELPPDSVVIFDEAGMASTRLSEQLLGHAATVGVKVIAIGDPGQLASVQAGGWLRTIGERLGAARLTEVMRQRDPAERLALAALHDGDPGRWIEWATHAGRVEVLPDGRGVLEQAVGEWAAGAAGHGVQQSVLISRDNETRRALNTLAREHRRDTGELGEERSYGPVTVAVGDRVIARNNERDLDIDNGTRGTIRHLDERGIVIETDAHLIRELPAGYVSEHVEHAYALTGHGMQGTTVEQATVVASRPTSPAAGPTPRSHAPAGPPGFSCGIAKPVRLGARNTPREPACRRRSTARCWRA